MSALVAALFKDHATAEQVRTALVDDGFPTDRVRLTSREEPGPAELAPAAERVGQLEAYFTQVFPATDEEGRVRSFVDGVRHGNAALVVHPRGDIETQRALEILNAADPIELSSHDLENQPLEQAASPASSTVVEKVVPRRVIENVNPKMEPEPRKPKP